MYFYTKFTHIEFSKWYPEIICLSCITVMNIFIPYKIIRKNGWQYSVDTIIHENASNVAVNFCASSKGVVCALYGELVIFFFCKRFIFSRLVELVFPHTRLQYMRYGKANEFYNVTRAALCNFFLAFNMIPTLFDNLLQVYSICFFHDSWASIWTPRNLVS